MKRELQISVWMIIILLIMVACAFGDDGKIEKSTGDDGKIEKPTGDDGEIENSIGMKFKYIKPGSFNMGSNNGTWTEKPVHKVKLSQGFYMQTTEVTQGQWVTIMGKNPSEFKDRGENFPVEKISWNDAKNFIKKLNSKEKIDKYRLPTEAEWEYACRAGSDTDYANGNSMDEMGWYEANSGEKTHLVAGKEANAWGLYDMHGNVSEWVRDNCKDRRSQTITKTYREGLTDPVSTRGRHRICRGGSWYDYTTNCRSAYRYSYSPGSRDSRLGFRLVKTP